MPKPTFAARMLPALTAIALFFLVWNDKASAAIVADGTYEVEYTVKKPDNDSVSIANDYFEKPARVEVRNGEAVVYFQTNHNKWMTSLQYPAGADAVALQAVEENEAEDKKVFRLPHANVLEPAVLQVHVKIDELGYDQAYSVRLVFKTEQLPLLDEAAPDAKSGDSAGEAADPGGTAGKDRPNPAKPPAAGPESQGPTERQEPANGPSATEPPQQPQPDEAGQPDAPVASGEEPQESQDEPTSDADGGATPDHSTENAASSVSGDDTAEQAAADATADPATEASGNSAWPIILTAILAVCVLAVGGGWAYRRRRSNIRS